MSYQLSVILSSYADESVINIAMNVYMVMIVLNFLDGQPKPENVRQNSFGWHFLLQAANWHFLRVYALIKKTVPVVNSAL